ncbi:MAG: hypothetical protein GW789_02190 [Ignavibacteria bacterium]|nr:hypothetical protein [Ignavibacteria bacterium]
MKTNSHNKTLSIPQDGISLRSILLTLVTTLAVVNATLFPYFGNNKLIRLFEGLYGENVYLCLCY